MPAKQSACSSTLTCRRFASVLVTGRRCALHLGQDAELVLHVMADLVRDHIGLRKFARARSGIAAVETPLDLAEERGVEIDLACPSGNRTAPSRTGPCPHASARVAPVNITECRRAIALPGLLEDLASTGRRPEPRICATNLPMSSLGAPVLPGGPALRPPLAAAGKDLGAADQQARIDPERVADRSRAPRWFRCRARRGRPDSESRRHRRRRNRRGDPRYCRFCGRSS